MYTKNIVRRDADGGHGHGGHGGGGHAHASAPSSGYDSPSPSYGAPSTGYGAPSSSYNEPSPSYGTPDTGYGAPATGYGGGGSSYDAAPSYGGDDGGLFPFDLSALIIPILAIVGLSLLFPVITTVDVKKRKRRDLSDLERGKSTKCVLSCAVPCILAFNCQTLNTIQNRQLNPNIILTNHFFISIQNRSKNK